MSERGAMSTELKQAVERLELLADSAFTLADERDAIRLVLSALSRAEAERDLLAAECRATRSWTSGKPEASEHVWWGGDEWGHMMNARAATDAAGVLKEGK